jgi:hypothetical protein
MDAVGVTGTCVRVYNFSAPDRNRRYISYDEKNYHGIGNRRVSINYIHGAPVEIKGGTSKYAEQAVY